ncbi:MAG: carboxypeptidase-like regulatory domain-containing protein [Acidobacteriota bacterium]
MCRLTFLTVAGIVIIGSAAALGQTPPVQTQRELAAPARGQGPQRDKPVTKTGTGAINGRIAAADSGMPLRRAKVSLETGNPLESRETTTDLDGRYEFTDLAAGQYRVSASKGSYVPLEYGQRKAFERGNPIDLTEGQVAQKVDITLPRGGVITGVLLDDVGDPAVGVRMTAMRQQYRDGKRALVSIGRAVETNDVGQYRLYGLASGSYFLGALPSTANTAIPLFNSPSGAPTYYPGTVSEMEAQRVTVQPAQERTLPDFTLVPSRAVKVTGTATNATGGPVQMVMIMSTSQMSGSNPMPGMKMGAVKPDGSFQLTNVAPGEYMIMATSNAGSGDQEISATPLTVAGEDITGVTLHTTSGFRATGQIMFEQGVPPAGVSPAALTLMAAPSSSVMTGTMARGTIRDDWTFEIKGLAGQRLFRFGPGLPSGWMIQSVFQGQTDLTDKPLDVTEDVDRVLITLTNRPARISGRVVDDRGKPVTDCSVVIFPDDAALWPPASTLYLRRLRPGDDGTFKTENLPAATYLVVAIESLEPGEENDTELLEQLRALTTRVMLGWGDAKDLPLKLKKFERR